jgi:hypothetical protein|tara:strand:+ start:1169 stop:2293 length:1125 start_codon:yes stop_codon:yes gene_type:complete
MAIYKIFPTADATLYSGYRDANTGLDEILEASTNFLIQNPQVVGPNPEASRFLLQFNPAEITSLFETKIKDSTWRADLRCFTANVTGLSSTSTLSINAIAESWNMGTGKYLDLPENQSGASWRYSQYTGGTQWTTSSYTAGTTGSYNTTTNPTSAGGGTWYTGSEASFTFQYYTDPDINANVTPIVTNWSSSAFENYGVIVRQSASQEFVDNINEQTTLKYFSRDTHTIYPPQLEFKWDDFTYTTGSLTVLNTLPATIEVSDNPGIFYSQSVNRFRVNARPKYPPRVYQTGSLYTKNYALPEESYYSIKDVYTNEVAISYDSTYTKVSCDSTGSFFDLYLDGLQPERYYRIEIKTTIGATVLIVDTEEFKISNK